MAALLINVFGIIVDNKINIALAIAGINIGQTVEFFRQGLQRFGNNIKFFSRDRKLSARSAADVTGNADDVADVKAFE